MLQALVTPPLRASCYRAAGNHHAASASRVPVDLFMSCLELNQAPVKVSSTSQHYFRPLTDARDGNAAGQQAMFDMSLRRNSPQRYGLLVATFYKALDADEASLSEQDVQSRGELMLFLLNDLKDMSPVWQREHLASVFQRMVKIFPNITTVMQQVWLLTHVSAL